MAWSKAPSWGAIATINEDLGHQFEQNVQKDQRATHTRHWMLRETGEYAAFPEANFCPERTKFHHTN
jgi:hypothetical protein